MPSNPGRYSFSRFSPHIAMRSVSVISGIVAIVLAARAVVIRAQDRQIPVVRITTRMVQLNVVVVDKQGKPVGGLSQDDFQVLDNGREQKLSHFSFSSTAVPGEARPAASPLVFTNRPQDQGESARSMTVILVDELVDQDIFAIDLRAMIQSARLAILKFLSTLQPGEQVALYALRAEGVVVVHDFTDDPTELVTVSKTFGSGLLQSATPTSAELGPSANFSHPTVAREIRGWLAGSNRKADVLHDDTLHRVIAGNALQAIAQHLQGIPGRKNVVWISSMFPYMVAGLDPGIMAGEKNTILPDPFSGIQSPHFANTESRYERMRAFARWLSSTNVSVYPIDPQGFMGPVTLLGTGADKKFYGPPPNVLPTVSQFSVGPWSTMDLVASETGGRAFYDTNGLDQILREVVDQNRVTYELGYYPGDSHWDGKYHKIEVRIKGEELTVHCRKGYFAVDAPLMPNPETALRDAARSVVEGLGIGLALKVPSNPLSWSRQDVVLNIDAHDVHFDQNGARWKAQLDVAFVQLVRDGGILDGAKDHLELVLHADTYDEAMKRGWSYPKSVDVKPEAEKLRVIVRDAASGAVGSISVPVRQPKGE